MTANEFKKLLQGANTIEKLFDLRSEPLASRYKSEVKKKLESKLDKSKSWERFKVQTKSLRSYTVWTDAGDVSYNNRCEGRNQLALASAGRYAHIYVHDKLSLGSYATIYVKFTKSRVK